MKIGESIQGLRQSLRAHSIWRRFDLMSIIALAGGLTFFASSWKLHTTTIKLEVLGPGGFGVGVSVLWIVTILISIAYEAIKPQTFPSYRIDITNIKTVRWILTVFLSLLYIVTVDVIGYIITNMVYMILLMTAYGATKKIHIVLSIILSAVITMGVYLVFNVVFQTPVPGEL